MKKNSALAVKGGLILGALAVLSGCNQLSIKQDQQSQLASCDVPSSKNVSQAFSQSTATLSDAQCHYQFDAHEQALMSLAKGDPGQQNRQYFYNFYTEAAGNGIISKRQAREHYSRYFTTGFAASLPDSHSNCATGDRMDNILADLKQEAHMKKEGLLEVLDDRNSWFTAKSHHDNLVLILETTHLACDDQT